MSSASNPLGGALPQRTPSRPEIVKPAPPRSSPRGLGWGLAALAVIAGAGLYLNRDRLAPKEGGGGPVSAATRTAVVAAGDLHRTLRVAGSVTAERFAAVTAPRLDGNRGSKGGNRVSTRGAGSGGGSSSSSSGSSSLTIASSNSANTSSSAIDLRGSTNRFGSSGGSGGGSGGGGGGASGSGGSGSSGADSGGGNSGGGGGGGGNAGGGDPGGGAGAGGPRGGGGGVPRAAGGGAPRGAGGGGGVPGGGGGGGGVPGGGGGPGGPGGPGGDRGDFSLVLLSLPVPGGRVKAGDVIAEFDRESMRNRIDDYTDAVTQAELNIKNRVASLAASDEAHKQKVRAAKASMDKAQLDLKTIVVISDIDAERYRLAAEESEATYKQLLNEVPLIEVSQKADLHNSEISLDTSKIELKKALANADRMILKSPLDGLIVMQAIRRGQEFAQVQKGDQVNPGQTFMQVVDPSSMVVNAMINQVDAEALRIGMKATIRLDAYPGLELPGHVYSIGAVPVAGRRPNFMRQIPIRLKLDKEDPLVLPDLSASAEIILATEKQATMAPLASVFQDNAAAKPYVFLRSAEGWIKREVELGLRSGVAVAVRSGLTKGDVVALDMPPKAAAGAGGSKPPA